MRARSVSPLVIESPRPPTCHPEREGGGWGGREGSPHKSRCRPTASAEILRSPRAHPLLAQDDTNFGLVHRARSFLRSGSPTAVKELRMTQTFVSAISSQRLTVNFMLRAHAATARS